MTEVPSNWYAHQEMVGGARTWMAEESWHTKKDNDQLDNMISSIRSLKINHTRSLKIAWDHWRSHEIIEDRMRSLKITRDHWRSHEIIEDRMRSLKITRDHWRSHEIIEDRMRSLKITWDHWRLHKIILDHQRSLKIPWNHWRSHDNTRSLKITWGLQRSHEIIEDHIRSLNNFTVLHVRSLKQITQEYNGEYWNRYENTSNSLKHILMNLWFLCRGVSL